MKKKITLLFSVMMLCIVFAFGQITGTTTYDFRDGTIITAGKSADGLLSLSGGSFKLHGATYGLNMKVGGEIKITVAGNSTIKFLGSAYSGLKLEGTAVTIGDLGSQDTKVAKDLSDTYDFVYSGAATTLTFKTVTGSGNDLYLPVIEVIPAQSGAAVTSAVKNVIYYFDLRDGSIIPNQTSLNGNYTIEKGLFKIECGPSNGYGYNGAQHGSILKTGNKITLQVAGNSRIRIGGCQYSNGTISVSSATGQFDLASQASKTAQCYDADGSTVNFLYAGTAGTVVLDFTGTTYIPCIEVAAVPYEVTLGTYVQKTGTITINGVTFTLTSGATAAESATVTLADGIVLKTSKSEAYIAMDLGGKDIATLTPTFTGDIASVDVASGNLSVTYANESSDPKSYTIKVYDNSVLHGATTYDFRDGTIISGGKSSDGLLNLSGTYKLHGAQYGLNMKVDGGINVVVAGSSTLKFLGSAYSSLKMMGTAKTEGDLGTLNTKVSTDLSDTYDFVYGGVADTLSFKMVAGSGSDVYLPTIDVIPAQMGAACKSLVKNVAYYFDFRDGSIVPTTTDGKSDINKGLVSIKVGSKNAYGYNGTDHGSILKEGNQMVLQVGGNAKIRVGGCQYSNGTISVSSVNGSFDKTSQSSQTTKCYHQDGSTIDFLYAGTAGTVVLDFTGTTYIPIVEVVPVPYAVELEPWVKKTGTIALNGTTISFTAGDNSTANATVTVSNGDVISATSVMASIRMSLSGKALGTYAPAVTGDIVSAVADGDTLKVIFSGTSSNPKSYKIVVTDNSTVVKAEAGKTYSYNFADGSVLPQTSYSALRYSTFFSEDGILNMNSNTDNTKGQCGYHDAAHGAVFFPGNSMEMVVAGNATITFVTCTYGVATDAIFEFTDANGTVLGSCAAQNIGKADGFASSFTYTGAEGVIKATLKSASFASAEVYIHGLSIENAAKIETSNGKTDVWDFGAVQLDSELYMNKLTTDIINSWYAPTITVGSSGNVLPSFTAGVLSWVGGSNDRLRTTNTSLTRYDQNIASATDYTGRVYVNSGAATGRYMSLTLSEDDEVTIVARTDAGGTINFQYVPDPASQTDKVTVSDLTELRFVAKQAGTYHIFDNVGKPSYFRIYRKDASYINLAGTVNVTEATGIKDGYGIVFKNEAGKSFKSIVTNNAYSIKIPSGYSYTLSLSDANGYIITNENTLEITGTTTSHNVTIKKVELFTVSGAITGLGTEIPKLGLVYTSDPALNKIFKPQPVINTSAGTYSVDLEPNCKYSISAQGVNDFYLPNNSITVTSANSTSDIVFESKPLYKVTIDAKSLNAEQLAKLNLTFTNLNESGYTYSFSSVNSISLRDGTYTVAYSGLDEYPLELGLTSNLKIEGAEAPKTLSFKAVTNWSFDDKAIPNGTTAYKGLLFTGTVASELAKGHLTAKPDATIQVPVKKGEKIRVTYYYSADFTINGGGPFTTSSGSTSTLEYAEYTFPEIIPGYVTITIGSGAGTTYITDISISEVVDYKSVVYVGADKEYTTINDALTAVAKMVRNNNERVTVMIDPGNYEEMLVISIPNVTLKNASANPDIDLKNKGVDISGNAVRITSYYGHGYNYFSMGNNQKWSADLLRVNKENGYLSYENKGSGTTNGSFWNATVVVSAIGFEAEDIIFENSFNQYISKKESEDIVVMWESGNKGLRPTDYGNTSVQKRSFVERAAAIAFNGADRAILKKCRIVGRQDSFFGGTGRVVVYKGAMMGAVDYIFGAMTAVFYKTDLVMNTSDDSNDASYLTAAQQSSGRGYLMYECNVTSATPGTETASTYLSKPGYFGRPWQATTSEVVFYNTTINTSNYTGSEGKSLISPAGWDKSLGGESKLMYEYGTVEKSGVDNSSSRASWATLLTSPTLTDGTAITTLNFTKGSDGWDPIPALVANDINSGMTLINSESSVQVYSYGDRIYISNVKSRTKVNIYSLNGSLFKSFETNTDTNFNFNTGFWIVKVKSADGQKAVKVLTQ